MNHEQKNMDEMKETCARRLIEISHGIANGEKWAVEACDRIARMYPDPRNPLFASFWENDK